MNLFNTVLGAIGNTIGWLAGAIAEDNERSLYDGSEMIGDMNFRTGEMDLGQDPGGIYEDDW